VVSVAPAELKRGDAASETFACQLQSRTLWPPLRDAKPAGGEWSHRFGCISMNSYRVADPEVWQAAAEHGQADLFGFIPVPSENDSGDDRIIRPNFAKRRYENPHINDNRPLAGDHDRVMDRIDSDPIEHAVREDGLRSSGPPGQLRTTAKTKLGALNP